MPSPASALEWNHLWSNPDQQATRLLEQGEFSSAAKQFEDPQWKANAHYRAEEYQESIKALEGIDTPDSWYNRGNALARSGQLAEAVQAYQTALERQPDHADSAFNKKLVEELLQQQQQNSDQNSDGKQSQDRSGNQEQNQEGDKQQSGQSEPNQSSQDGESSGNQGESRESESTANQKQGRNQAEPEMVDQKQPATADATRQGTDHPEQEANASVAQESETTESEADQAVEQWLRRIPDDPGGLLRRKFRYQYQRQQQPPPESEQW
ncbi:MAG: tetratricopeptide repeat protein [Gammaproteobacteria bacterium]|nr:tetratricopeptide repeat protein [Gammaproteobacteria bacterium]